jgi:hypothetical protein
MVLATIVDAKGKPVKDGAAKGQLYASRDEICVVKVSALQEMHHRGATILLLGSVLAVIVNVFTWKNMNVLWAALFAQAVYWLTMRIRRQDLEPVQLSTEGIEAARKAGRLAIRVPAQAVLRAVPPAPQRTGFRKPARFELPDGALEMFLSDEQFKAVAGAIGRGG